MPYPRLQVQSSPAAAAQHAERNKGSRQANAAHIAGLRLDTAVLPRHAVQAQNWTAPLGSQVPRDPAACLQEQMRPRHARQTLGDRQICSRVAMHSHAAPPCICSCQWLLSLHPLPRAVHACLPNAALQHMPVQTARAAAPAPSMAHPGEHTHPLCHCSTAAHSPECRSACATRQQHMTHRPCGSPWPACMPHTVHRATALLAAC